MTVIVRLNLTKYDADTLLIFYRNEVITRDELEHELLSRGYDAWTVVKMVRRMSA